MAIYRKIRAGIPFANRRMRMFSPSSVFWKSMLVALFCGQVIQAITLDEIRHDASLTPQRFAAYFATFDFEFRAEVQAPEVFLATKSGDCDDFAILGAKVLKEKGYTPRLIAVRMPGMVHVVCYIEETHSYLDYNNRKTKNAAVDCDGVLPAIAKKVAKSFGSSWTSVSEFQYEDGLKRLVSTVVQKSLYASK